MQESPIFSKTSELLEWLIPATMKFPKSQRFVLAQRVQNAAFDFYEAITAAGVSANKRPHLQQADIELQRLRLYLRLSHQFKFLSMGQYEHAARLVVEIGKLLGGWQKKAGAPAGGAA
jgi:hypothetical protein